MSLSPLAWKRAVWEIAGAIYGETMSGPDDIMCAFASGKVFESICECRDVSASSCFCIKDDQR